MEGFINSLLGDFNVFLLNIISNVVSAQGASHFGRCPDAYEGVQDGVSRVGEHPDQPIWNLFRERAGMWKNIRRYRSNMPDIVGDFPFEQVINLKSRVLFLCGRSPLMNGGTGLAKNQDGFGHNVWVIVARIRVLNCHPGPLHPAGDFVPDDFLVEEIPQTRGHQLRKVMTNRVMLTVEKHGSDYHRTETARHEHPLDFPETSFQPI